jgi:glycosyltransferase involved in cell wall biosynthesis
MKKNILTIIFCVYSSLFAQADLVISGPLDFCDGLGRNTYGFIDQLSNNLDVRLHVASFCLLADDPYHIKKRVKKQNEIGNPKIFLYTNGVVSALREDCYCSLPKETLKVAYSMFEATEIPYEWVDRLNKYFDVVLVPDAYHVDVYKNSGVTLPIYVLPTGLYLEEYLKYPEKKETQNPFTFGCVSTNTSRKNLKRIIDAFIKQYGNNPDYRLYLHVKYPLFVSATIEEYAQKKGITNIEVSSDLLDEEEYAELLQSFDCYILLSMGEGFSNTPREALASGVPIIISDNTAQSTICKSGYAVAVASKKEVDAWYEALDRSVGKQFDCNQEDVIAAMEYVVQNYSKIIDNTKESRKWVKQYEWKNLKDSYLAFFKPQNVLLGANDSIDAKTGTVTTSDKKLYEKMRTLIS